MPEWARSSSVVAVAACFRRVVARLVALPRFLIGVRCCSRAAPASPGPSPHSMLNE